MGLRRLYEGTACARFGNDETDASDASVTRHAPKRDVRDERDAVTRDEFAALRSQVEKLTLQVARLQSAMSAPPIMSGVLVPADDSKAKAAARAAAYRKRKAEVKS